MKNISDGVWPTMLTPYTEDLQIDWNALDALIDWYIANNVNGLFAVCLSSEIFKLSAEERIQLSRHVVRRCAGRIEVVSGMLADDYANGAAEEAKKLFSTGCKAVVCMVNQLFPEGKPLDECYRNIEKFLELTGDIPLGLYECPVPRHKLLDPELLSFLIATGRFCFLKDTSCDIRAITSKLDIMRDTGCKLFNAHTPTLLAGLKQGGSGYSGIASNYYPELFAAVCDNFREKPAVTQKLSDYITVADELIHKKYSISAKYYLQLCGLPVLMNSRNVRHFLTESDKAAVEALYRMVGDIKRNLGLDR